MQIQVVGLPGMGKSTALHQLRREHLLPFLIFDLADYTDEYSFKVAVKRQAGHTILESACGIRCRNSKVIKLQIAREQWLKNLEKRGDIIDLNYFSLLETRMIRADIVLNSSEAVCAYISSLLKE